MPGLQIIASSFRESFFKFMHELPWGSTKYYIVILQKQAMYANRDRPNPPWPPLSESVPAENPCEYGPVWVGAMVPAHASECGEVNEGWLLVKGERLVAFTELQRLQVGSTMLKATARLNQCWWTVHVADLTAWATFILGTAGKTLSCL